MKPKPMIVRNAEGEELNILGVAVRFLCSAKNTAGAWSLMENVIPRDAGPPPHTHAWDEAYYVVAGEVLFDIEDEARRVRAGDFVYAPGGTLHGFKGASDEPARMLIFDAPAHAEAFFRRIDEEVTALPRDAHKLPGIGRDHGVRFAGAPEPQS